MIGYDGDEIGATPLVVAPSGSWTVCIGVPHAFRFPIPTPVEGDACASVFHKVSAFNQPKLADDGVLLLVDGGVDNQPKLAEGGVDNQPKLADDVRCLADG